MGDWGQKTSPLWPERATMETAAWSKTSAWPGGPTFGEVVLEVLPLIRCYFLLGYRVSSLSVMDYITGPSTSPLSEGRTELDLQTGASEPSASITKLADVSGTTHDLVDGQVHVVFHLEELTDQSGFLGPLISDPGGATFKGYGVPLAASRRVLSLYPQVADLLGLEVEADVLLDLLIGTTETNWIDASGAGEAPRLRRSHQGGMLWVFDPIYWARLSGRRKSDYRAPKNLLKHLFANSGASRQFLLEQVFDLRMRDGFFKSTGTATTASCAAARRSDTHRPAGRPNLGHYSFQTELDENATSTEHAADYAMAVRPGDFFYRIRKNIDQRGETHLWSYMRRKVYIGGDPAAWLDTILALAWEGAIEILDAVNPRTPAEPIELVTREKSGKEFWEIRVHGIHALTLTLRYPTDTTKTLKDKAAFDYKPGTAKDPPSVMIVAGRGVDIDVHVVDQPTRPAGGNFKAHYKKYFQTYANLMPWRLEIFRVQEDSLVPAPGAEINPLAVTGSIWLNPSPLVLPATEPGEPVDPTAHRVPQVSLVYPLNYRPGNDTLYDRLLELKVRVTSHPHGVKIEFPVVQAATTDVVPPESQDADLFQGVLAPGAAVWNIDVNPFSGYAGYTYDLFLEQFDHAGMNLKNVHLVVILTEDTANDVQLKTTLGSGFSLLYEPWQAAEDLLDPQAPEHQGYWGTRGAFHADATSEFWKTRNAGLHRMPPPQSVKLPVTMPPLGSAAQWMNSPSETNRGDQSWSRMPQPDDMLTSGWGSARYFDRTWPEHDDGPLEPNMIMSIKRLDASEWADIFVDDVIFLIIDVSLGFIPIVGDAADVAELVIALMTGRDRWGRPVTGFDLVMMTIGAAAPMISSRALLVGGDVAFGRSLNDALQFETVDPRESFFQPLGGLLRRIHNGDGAAEDELHKAAIEFMDLSRYNPRINSVDNRKKRAKRFAENLIAHRAVVLNRLDAIRPDNAREYLKFEDLVDDNGEFIFWSMQQGFETAASRHFEKTGERLNARIYLQLYSQGTARAMGEAILGLDAVRRGGRARARGVASPSAIGRMPRRGTDVPISSISGDDLVSEAIAYFRAVVGKDETIKIQGAGYGPDHLADARAVLKEIGFTANTSADITNDHKMIVMLKKLMGGQAAGYPKLAEMLVDGRKTNKQISKEECGARVGEALLMAMDQMVHMGGVSELQGGLKTLDEIYDGMLAKPVRDFIGQWVHGNGNVFEHALKSELVESSEIHSRINRMYNPVDPDDPDEFAGFLFWAISQGKLPSINGKVVQKGSDEVVYFTLPVTRPDGTEELVRYAADMQLKAFKTLERVIGFNVVDDVAVTTGRFYGSAIPRVVQDVRVDPGDGILIWTYKVEGGSTIFKQLVKQRLRKARYKGWAPPPNLAGDPPLNLPADPGTTAGRTALQDAGWVRESPRNIYTINTAHLLDSLSGKLFKSIPEEFKANVRPEHLWDFDKDEIALLEMIYPELTDAASPVGINLFRKTEFYNRFDAKAGDVRDVIMDWLKNYETRVDGFEDAMMDLSDGVYDPATAVAQQTFIRFTSDGSPDEGFRFLVLQGVDDP